MKIGRFNIHQWKDTNILMIIPAEGTIDAFLEDVESVTQPYKFRVRSMTGVHFTFDEPPTKQTISEIEGIILAIMLRENG